MFCQSYSDFICIQQETFIEWLVVGLHLCEYSQAPLHPISMPPTSQGRSVPFGGIAQTHSPERLLERPSSSGSVAVVIFLLPRAQTWELRTIVLLWFLLLFLHVVRETDQGLLSKVDNGASSTIGLTRSPSPSCASPRVVLTKAIFMCLHLSFNLWVGDKDPAKSEQSRFSAVLVSYTNTCFVGTLHGVQMVTILPPSFSLATTLF